VTVEIAYRGELGLDRAITGLADNGGHCNLSADGEHAPVADHATARLSFRAVWRMTLPLHRSLSDGSMPGRVRTGRSRFAYRGVYYDDRCGRHAYPTHGPSCRGGLGAGERPSLDRFSQGSGRVGLWLDPAPSLRGAPSSCRVSPSSSDPSPPDRTVDAEVVDALPDAAEAFTVRAADLLHHATLTHAVGLAARGPDRCAATGDREQCSARITGSARVTVRRLHLIR
jgi:hypothetical protein